MHPFELIEKYEGKASDQKFIDEMPIQGSPKAKDFEGYLTDRNRAQYNPNEKELNALASPNPTLNTIQKKKKDPVMRKKTVYDLAGQNDWRRSSKASTLAGPIDHIAKNKAQFSNKQKTLSTATATGTSYLKQGSPKRKSTFK